MKTQVIALIGLLCATAALAQTNESTAAGPVAFSPTASIPAAAPGPAATRVRTGQYALDSLATTPTSYNQIQTIGVYGAAHLAPTQAIKNYLGNVTGVSGLTTAKAPNSTQYSQQQLYNQLDTYGARSLQFTIYYDPTGTLYQTHAGLAIVNATTANTSIADPKWGYPGWKVMAEPNFDFNTTCTTLATCLQNVNNWLLITPNTVPLTIYLDPTNYTYVGNGSNTTFANALGETTTSDAPSTLAQPLDITTYQPLFQPWRDLENELKNVFGNYTLVKPADVMEDAANLNAAVLQNGYTLYPSLESLKSRVIVVLSSYVDNYLQYYPDLVNATMFVSEPYNSAGNYTNSTLFVDFLGSLPGVNSTSFNSTAATNASNAIAAEITSTVEAGYMVRAAADWLTVEARNNFGYRASSVQQAGAHFVQTSFPYQPTLFQSSYSVALPVRGNQQQSAVCNPITTGGLYFNATAVYSVGCPAVSSAPGSAPAAAPAATTG